MSEQVLNKNQELNNSAQYSLTGTTGREIPCGPTLFFKEGQQVFGISNLEVQVGGSHYKQFVIQPMEYNVVNSIPFAEGNIIKYVSRWKLKGGVEDLKKARHILNYLIEVEEKNDRT